MTAHSHRGVPHSRAEVIDHLRDYHAWDDGHVMAGYGEFGSRVLPACEVRLGDGGYLQPTSELLAIHRELHALEFPTGTK